VRKFDGATTTLDVTPLTSIADVKARIDDKAGIPAHHQRLIFEGKQVEDELDPVLCFGALCFCVFASPAGRVFCVFVFWPCSPAGCVLCFCVLGPPYSWVNSTDNVPGRYAFLLI
jgi:hypothetical protein